MAANDTSCPGAKNRNWLIGSLVLVVPILAFLPTADQADCQTSLLCATAGLPDPDDAKDPVPLTERQKLVLKALEKGIDHLRTTQTPQGTWTKANAHPVGYAAMPALALLEVGVPAADPAIQRAAQFVRTHSVQMQETYEIMLAILFLNRLDDAKDVPLIRTLAYRLIAGQCQGGGWSYRCPILAPVDEQLLLTYLNKNQPRFGNTDSLVMHPYLRQLPKGMETLVDPLIRKEKEASLQDPTTKSPDKLTLPDLIPKESKYDPSKKTDPPPSYDPNKKPDTQPKSDPGANKPSGEVQTPPPLKEAPDSPKPGPKDPPKPGPDPWGLKKKPKQPAAKQPAATMTAQIQQWPAVPPFVKQMAIGANANGWAMAPQLEDNSNTQFAILGLWAARKHGVPVTLTLVRLDQRFRSSQFQDGSWAYHLPGFAGDPKKAKHQMPTPSMTCVGLMGLGVSHGAFQEAVRTQRKNPAPPEYLFDPAIQRGLSALSRGVDPRTNFERARVNLYFFWSLERTMVMFHLPTIGGVDWHTWGTDVILSRQTANGSWDEKGYPGSSEPIDTSMALLFLSRANLNRDLSESLRRYIVVIDPARAKAP